MESEQRLPEGWERVPLADVCQKVPNVKPEDEPEREFGYVDISSISNTTFTIGETKRFSGKDAPSRARRPIVPGDVLFSTVRTYLRNIAMVPEGLDADLCSTGFTVLRSNGAVIPRYLFYHTLSDEFIDAVTPQQTGSQYPATSDRVVLSTPIPLAPLFEQRRIVARLEALLADVARVRGRLEAVAATMQRFRQAVLTAAFDGRLIGVKKVANSDEEISRGLDPTFNWVKTDLETISELVTDGEHNPPSRAGTGIPYLTAKHVQNGKIVIENCTFIGTEDFERCKKRYNPQSNDIVITCVGSIGKTALVPEKFIFTADRNLAIIRPNTSQILPQFLIFFLNTPSIQKRLLQGSGSTAQPHLYLKDIRAIRILLPPLLEQHEIVRRVEALFALADKIDNEVAGTRERVEALTQAILAKAFRGELVPTEAELARREGREYEPAGVLLERVRAGRQDGRPKPQGRKRRVSQQSCLSPD